MPLMLHPTVVKAVKTLHRSSFLRTLAKTICKGRTLRQSFHGGVICFDAVEHSWAWTGNIRYETFDAFLQDRLLTLSSEYDHFIDIGCNVGAMTLSVLLRNPNITATCIDPNERAVELLKASLKKNRLDHRAEVVRAVVSTSSGEVRFDDSGSVHGHVSDSGDLIQSLDFIQVIHEHSSQSRCLVKIDVEGYERELFTELSALKPLNDVCFIVELHPQGFNGIGDPQFCLEALKERASRVTSLDSVEVGDVQEHTFSHVLALVPGESAFEHSV